MKLTTDRQEPGVRVSVTINGRGKIPNLDVVLGQQR